MNKASRHNHKMIKRTFHFVAGETVEEGIRRMICEQLDYTIWQLKETPEGLEKAIHRSRKSFKRIRAVLRLIRDQLSGKRYRRENICYRDIGRLLAPGRDSVAQIKTLDNLLERSKDKLSSGSFGKVREKLTEQQQAVYQSTLDDGNNLEQVIQDLQKARKRAQKLKVKTNGFPALQKGLCRTYGQGRTRFSDAYDISSVEVFHDWRKRVKYLWNMCKMIKPASPDEIDKIVLSLKQVSDLLGMDHDLSDLRVMLSDNPHWFRNSDDMNLLFSVIDEEIQTLRKKARPIGKNIYAEKPRAFAKRVGRYWNDWQESYS